MNDYQTKELFENFENDVNEELWNKSNFNPQHYAHLKFGPDFVIIETKDGSDEGSDDTFDFSNLQDLYTRVPNEIKSYADYLYDKYPSFDGGVETDDMDPWERSFYRLSDELEKFFRTNLKPFFEAHPEYKSLFETQVEDSTPSPLSKEKVIDIAIGNTWDALPYKNDESIDLYYYLKDGEDFGFNAAGPDYVADVKKALDTFSVEAFVNDRKEEMSSKEFREKKDALLKDAKEVKRRLEELYRSLKTSK